MKYKVGDKVKIRSDLEVGKEYGNYEFAIDMKEYGGDIVTIAKIWNETRDYYNFYDIEEDDRFYSWTDEMIEGKVEDMEKKELKGWELIKAISEKKIQEGTFFLVHDYSGLDKIVTTIEYKGNKLNWKSGDFDTSYLVDNYITFEILEKPEEINIQDIKEVPQVCIDNCTDRNYAYVGEKINEIIKYLKQLDRKENKQ